VFISQRLQPHNQWLSSGYASRPLGPSIFLSILFRNISSVLPLGEAPRLLLICTMLNFTGLILRTLVFGFLNMKSEDKELAVPWLRWLVAGLPPRKPGFDPRSVPVGFVVYKVTLGHVFPRVLRFFPCQFHSSGVPLLGKMKKLITFLFIFITGLHNKP
jgi:hypothetical protein